MVSIGVDVGGTYTRTGVVDDTGCVLDCTRQHTPTNATGEALVQLVANAIRALERSTKAPAENETPRDSIGGVGLALPGVTDSCTGQLIHSVNLPGVEGYPIANDLAEQIGCSVQLMTDIQAATWAEYEACNPRPNRFVHIRLGTGVGVCAVLDGRLEIPDISRTTHHLVLVIDSDGRAERCPCGLRGCAEHILSARALAAQMNDVVGGTDLSALQTAWVKSDPPAIRVIDHAAAALAVVLANVVRAYEAEAITVGGGVIMAVPSLLDRAVEVYETRLHDAGARNNTTIHAARLGDLSGVIGAARFALLNPTRIKRTLFGPA